MYAISSDPKKLPADAMPPLFALSLRRKLRNLYNGQLFKYREGTQEYDYPARPINGEAYLVKIYDQKSRFGLTAFNAEQNNTSKQPLLIEEDGGYTAKFKLGDHLDLVGSPARYIVSPDFTITAIGDGDIPRPMIGIWGESDRITVEPGSPVNRFTFNQNIGSIGENTNNKINQMRSGIDPSQNGKRVLTMISDLGGKGQLLNNNITTEFTSISIGRESSRYFSGEFIEATMHLSDLSRLAARYIWNEATIIY